MDVDERSSIRIIKRVLSASPLLVVIFCIVACSQSARFTNCSLKICWLLHLWITTVAQLVGKFEATTLCPGQWSVVNLFPEPSSVSAVLHSFFHLRALSQQCWSQWDSLSLPLRPVPLSHPLTDVFRCHQRGGNWCGDPPHCSTITNSLCASYVNGLRCTWLPLSLIILQLTDYSNASLRRFCLTEHLLCSGTCLHGSFEYLKRLVLVNDMTVSVSLCVQLREKSGVWRFFRC